MKTRVTEYRMATGIGRVWRIRANLWGWAIGENEGVESTFEDAYAQMESADMECRIGTTLPED